MFRRLFSALISGDELDRAFQQLQEMLGHGRWMFGRAVDVLYGRADAASTGDAIYSRDRAINDLERSIRRKILRHLTINPGTDAAACLVLMSITKDAERIGDYCKNVFEVGRFYRDDFRVADFTESLESICPQVDALFGNVSQAVKESSVRLAKAAIESAAEIRRSCDDIIERLLRDEIPMEVHQAVAYSMLARHYKRVAAHLGNIATAVLGRVEDLDFHQSDG
ncbi:MAG: hypothetical protein KF817_11930 [Phycisphaeraceae bacterium]|nr:hypothetical protein [Phycisphaeraceae bacterium]